MWDDAIFVLDGIKYLYCELLWTDSRPVFRIEDDNTLTWTTYHTFLHLSDERLPMDEEVKKYPIAWFRDMVHNVDEWDKHRHTYSVFIKPDGTIKIFKNWIWEVQVGREIDKTPYKEILASDNYPQETIDRIIALYKLKK